MGKTKFDTCFFERYAMISLQTLLGDRYSCLVNEDRPDLQTPDHSLGIEVTRAMEENKSVADSLLLEMAGIIEPDDDSDAQDDYLSIIDSGYAYGLRNGRYIGSKEYDYWALALPLRRIIAGKVEKVSSGFYGHFSDFGLYVFCKDHLSEDEVDLTVSYTAGLQHGLKTSFMCRTRKFHGTCAGCFSEKHSPEVLNSSTTYTAIYLLSHPLSCR